jgi:superoxide dismutase, Cu-Zn family
MFRTITGTAALVAVLVAGAAAQEPLTARADLIDRDGHPVGHVTLTQTPHHGIILSIEAWGLEPGVRAIHIHEVGRCDPPDFDSAGGHFNPTGAGHGAMHPEGMHVGDLLNLQVPEDGRVVTERHAHRATLVEGEATSLLGGDGTAIVIHASADDYASQPTGDAGGRVACGVIRTHR